MHKLGQPSLPNRVYQFYKRVTRKRYSKIILYMSITKIAAAVAGITLAALASTASAQTTSCYSFTLNHKLGNVGGEVMMVQKFLNMSAATQVAATGAGSAGLETTRFGGLTKAAVMKFQAANGVSPVSGYWGPLTRAKANALEAARCANNNNSNNNTTPATGDATLAAAPQPGNSLAPAGAARVPFTKFTVTAGSTAVTLNSVTVERGGLASDTAFANVILLDDMGNQLGTEKVLNSNHQATIGTPVVIPAGSTKTFTVAANMATSTTTSAGQVAVFSVVSANASGTVGGSLPITGAQHTINASLALGQATVDRGPLDPISAVTKEIGTVGYTFASYKITAGSAEKVRVWGIRVNQAGSVAGSDLANLKMVVDGTEYAPTWSADGKYAQFNFPGGIVIDKGLVKEFSVKGDVVGGSGRTISMDIYRLTDIQVTGETYGYGITPTATGSFSSSANPAYNAGDVTVNAGTFNSVQKSALAPAANVGKQKANEIIGAFTVDLKGEKVQIQALKMDLTVDAGSTSRQITNVTLVDQNGAVLAGPSDSTVLAVSGGNNANALTFSAVTFPAGATTVYVKGQLDSNWAQDDTVTVITTPSTQWTGVTGETSGNNISLASLSAPISANTQTVKAAALAVNTLTTPSAQTVVKGSAKHHFATVSLDGSNSGEDVRVSNITLTDTVGGGGAVTNIDNVELWADLTSANNADVRMGKFETRVKSAEQFTAGTLGMALDTHVNVAKNSQVEVGVFADVSSAEAASATHQIKATATAAVGLVSGATVTPTIGGATGQVMTVANTGTLAISLAPSSPAAKQVVGNVAGVDLAVLKLRAENEDVDLQQLKLALTSGTAASLAGNKIMVYDGATKVGEATFSGTTATVYFTPNFRAPKGADKNITLKADLAAIGTNQAGVAGASVKVDFDGDTAVTASTKGVGASSGTTVVVSTDVAPLSPDTTSNGVITFKSIPTVARIALPASNNLVNGTTDLFRFSVKADAAGDVSLYKVSVTSTGTGVTYTAATAKVIAYTDAAFSTPISGSFTSGEVLTGGSITSGTPFDGVFSAVVTIPAGQTYYFKVVSDIAGVDATGDSVSTKLLGDAAPVFANVEPAATVDGDANDDFIWSGNSTGTPVAATDDWYNGYSVVGLPASDTDASTNTRAN
jgi:hypothetical protein